MLELGVNAERFNGLFLSAPGIKDKIMSEDGRGKYSPFI
jgi:hypothetical protein